ncbi:winged helix-turn-helix domain-containing protein [Chitinophaga silvatica]|uniref:winged helix-turn-helix domain-containing protein n=1 Tax=Chitinophaga silvatica TaxID=2282649 RepID=UPI0011C18262|nr:winged helix-turn-helix domain-containing protein [Chitinophaga silvatica]
MRHLYTRFTILFLLVTFSLNSVAQEVSEQENRKLILFRRLGHRLLLTAGDSTSRVTVHQSSNHSYQISGERPFKLVPDSLVNIAEILLKDQQIIGSYTLTVSQANSGEIVYGFTSEDIIKGNVACVGRSMHEGQYIINIQLPSDSGSGYVTPILSGLLVIVSATAGIQFYKKRKQPKQQAVPTKSAARGIAIGSYTFCPDTGVLIHDAETTALTAKELTLLNIFVRQMNQVIDRNLLLKEGWEDEGVITGRSLDMYVSKLRKKFQKDASISIKNIHGKGYSLNIS